MLQVVWDRWCQKPQKLEFPYLEEATSMCKRYVNNVKLFDQKNQYLKLVFCHKDNKFRFKIGFVELKITVLLKSLCKNALYKNVDNTPVWSIKNCSMSMNNFMFIFPLQRMLKHLKDKKDVGFFSSLAGLMQQCRWDTYTQYSQLALSRLICYVVLLHILNIETRLTFDMSC